jgi:hypothetical protein
MTRICKLKGFHGFVGGKDNDNIFDEGIIYSVKKVMGEIILTPICEQPEYDSGGNQIEMLNLEQIIGTGDYLLGCK